MTARIFTYGISRSGTTLLTTVLDSHPDISMGYELLTQGIDDAATGASEILKIKSDDARFCSAELRVAGFEQMAALVHRADRALVSPVELAGILRAFSDEGRNDLESLKDRTALAMAITDLKARKEGNSVSGFKLNSPRIGAFDQIVGETAAYVAIVRDPRDVWRSHVEKKFDRTVEDVARAWTNYLQSFANFAKKNPGRCHLLRYEDLVQKPAESLDSLCAALGLSRDPAMDKFYESKASVLRGGHVNSDELERDFFTSSVDRWRDEVNESELRTLETGCHEGMQTHGYDKVTLSGFRFRDKEWTSYQERMVKKRKYLLDEYAGLVLPAAEAMPHRTWHEATSTSSGDQPDEVLVIRHDIDHDIENAVKLARWEAQHGIRSTYCVLHSAWYYGRFTDGKLTAHSESMVERCLEIQSLGHEINLHNNAVVVALRTKTDPYDVLGEELQFLRDRGLDVRGTSTHGDPLCGQLGFYNLELFSECVYPSNGGARTLSYEGHEVTIGTRSMSEFGLTYEGYDLPRDVYITDSGGNLRAVTGTRGRAGQSRAEMDPAPPYPHIVGILTHPEWWNLEQETPPVREDVSFSGLVQRAVPAQ